MSLVCPFCDYRIAHCIDESFLAFNEMTYHVEFHHPECELEGGLSPSGALPPHSLECQASASPVIEENVRRCTVDSSEGSCPASRGSTELIECPDQCGERILGSDLAFHLALHEAEFSVSNGLKNQDSILPQEDHGETRTESSTFKLEANSNRGAMKHPLDIICGSRRDARLTGNNPRKDSGVRLGKKELGPYAYEERMPSWLFKQLERGAPVTWANQITSDGKTQRVERVANETHGLISHLADLCEKDSGISKAWLCSAGVNHIFKMHREGGFCGYRNIQMLVSWMQYNKYPGHEHFPGSTPNILHLQRLIENAWDDGFNTCARAQTGGIIGTRKFIGTPEAQALLQCLGIGSDTRSWTRERTRNRMEQAQVRLLEQVLEYFSEDPSEPTSKVYRTEKPPLYLQHPGHSMTVVGLEVRKDGAVNLLVFDPMYPTSSSMMRYLNSPTSMQPSRVLKSFRRGSHYLGKYRSFELLSLGSLSFAKRPRS